LSPRLATLGCAATGRHALTSHSRRDQEELGRANPGLVFAGGGFPIHAEGLLAGGIGVSGASAHEDAELALGALARAGFDFDFGGGQIDREEGEDG